jgi:endonuclease-3
MELDLTRLPKKPFDIEDAISRIRAAIAPFPKAALFELYERGFTSLFEQLIACIISIRTLDEVTIPTAERLFSAARTPAQVAGMTPAQIDRRIERATFHTAKARSIQKIAVEVVTKYGGELPCDDAVLAGLPGVGPKCANLALGIACGQGGIGVDIHVHRVTNRWGYVDAPTPEKTMAELEGKLPREHWVEINKLLVPFGKHICTGKRPRCSTCPVLEMCLQIGVTDYR